MEYQLLRQGRVVYYEMEAILDMAAVKALTNRLKVEVFDLATSPVYIIIDLRPIKQIPPSILSSSLSMMRRGNSGQRRTVLITDKGYVLAMAQVLDKTNPNRLLVRKTLDEALEAVDELLALEA